MIFRGVWSWCCSRGVGVLGPALVGILILYIAMQRTYHMILYGSDFGSIYSSTVTQRALIIDIYAYMLDTRSAQHAVAPHLAHDSLSFSGPICRIDARHRCSDPLPLWLRPSTYSTSPSHSWAARLMVLSCLPAPAENTLNFPSTYG